MKAAVIFENYGPYHCARLTAANRIMDIVAIELQAVSQTYPWSSEDSRNGFEKVTLFQAGERHLFNGTSLLCRLDAALRGQEISAVYVNGWGDLGATSGIYWAVTRGIPLIYMSESSAMDDSRRFWREIVKRRLVGLGSAGLVGGQRHLSYMTDLGMGLHQVFTGYDAVDNDYFSAGADQARKNHAECRKQSGLPAHYFLASSRFIEKKNLTRLIRAYAGYRRLTAERKRHQPKIDVWDLVLLGDGGLRPELEKLVADLGLQSFVHLPGFKQYYELPVYYGLAGAFIHASIVEQWGLVVNEAMASGLPVLVSNRCGCSADLVRDGQNGFTFDPYDIEQMATLMTELGAMPERERQQLGKNSQQLIADWGPDAFASGMARAIEVARQTAVPRIGMIDRLLLGALIRR